jgi:sugar phosphate isomerase/epimerase
MYRRKILLAIFLPVLFASFSLPAASQQIPPNEHPATDVYDGWRLAIQAWTFNRFTFYEAIDKTASLGLDWIEAYPGQSLSREKPDVEFDHNTSKEIREQVKQKLKDAGIKLVNYGVVDLGKNEAKCRKVFEFARDMGIETIVSEPPADAFDLIEKLCEEYKINLAIHNHPKPTRYWNPDKVLKVCQGRSKRIGACADTGHWMRSGINPLEALKKLQGRIISLHFKDLNKFGQLWAHDCIWGTGKADIKALLDELHRQNLKAVFSIEYEYNWENSLPEIRECVQYFNKVSAELKPTGWKDLLADDLSNCIYKPGSWAAEDGILTRKGGGDIWTKEKYGDFILDLEFKLDEGSNSGVFIRTGSIENWLHTAIEVQIHESTDGTTRGACGAIYDCLAPSKAMVVKKAGQWNHYTITCKANKIYVLFNGQQIIDMDLDLWTEPHKNPDGSKNKFKTAYKDMTRSGHIGFQDHGDPIWFRNIKIKSL